MGEEYQELYGDMVNRLMTLKKHYSEITDDYLRAMNLPNTREVDTMQQRLQQLRRENIAMKKEIGEIRALLQTSAVKPVTAKAPTKKSPVKKAATRASTAKKSAVKKAAVKKQPAVSKAKKGA